MKHLTLAIFLFVSLSATSTPAQESEGTSAIPLNAPAEAVAVDDVADDRAIMERLQTIYAAAEKAGWLVDVDVQLDSGIVTLQGQADNNEHREWAENVARKTVDVVAVINQLAVTREVDLQSTQQVVRSSLQSMWTDILVSSPLFIAGLLMVLLTSVFAKLISWTLRKLLDKRGMRTSLKDLFYLLSSIGVWIVGLLISAVIAFPGMTPSKALAVLGLGSVAVGFAFKDIFENFFAGLLILWKYPFDRGDFITCQDVTGEVQNITIRNTLIRKVDGELTVIPNATLFKNNVDVLTSLPQRRVRIACGIAYGEDVDAARQVIVQAVQSCDTVQGKRTVQVFAQEFADSSISFEVTWWTGSKLIDIRRSRDEVISAIKRALDTAGIEIPFPYRTLTFKNEKAAAAIQQAFGSSKGL